MEDLLQRRSLTDPAKEPWFRAVRPLRQVQHAGQRVRCQCDHTVGVAEDDVSRLDPRPADESVLAKADELLHGEIARIEETARVTVERRPSHSWGVTRYQREGVELARRAAGRLGLSHTDIMTVAGHDSINMKDLVPTVMLFVPSSEGISHNEFEFTTDEDMLAGLRLLTEVVRGLAAGELNS